MSKKKKNNVIINPYDNIITTILLIIAIITGCIITISNFKHLTNPSYNIIILLIFSGLIYLLSIIPEKFNRYAFWCIIALAFLLRFIFILKVNTYPDSDFGGLYNAAMELSQGIMDSFADGTYLNRYGYYIPAVWYETLFVNLFADNALFALKFANCLFMSGQVAMIMLIADNIFGKKASVISGFIYAVYPAPIILSSVLTSQHQEVFFFLLAVYFLTTDKTNKYLSSLFAGISLTLAHLFRPEGIILICAVIFCFFWKFVKILSDIRSAQNPDVKNGFKQNLKTEIIGLIIFFLVFGIIYFSVNAAVKSSGCNNYGMRNAEGNIRILKGMDAETHGYYTEKYGYIAEITDETERQNEINNALKANIAAYPNGLLDFEFTKFVSFWSRYEDPYWSMGPIEGAEGLPDYALTFVAIERALALAIWFLFTFAAIKHFKAKYINISGSLMYLLVFANFAVYLIAELQPRYRYLIMPFVIISAASFCISYKNMHKK